MNTGGPNFKNTRKDAILISKELFNGHRPYLTGLSIIEIPNSSPALLKDTYRENLLDTSDLYVGNEVVLSMKEQITDDMMIASSNVLPIPRY